MSLDIQNPWLSTIKEASYSRVPVGISLLVSTFPILAVLEIHFYNMRQAAPEDAQKSQNLLYLVSLTEMLLKPHARPTGWRLYIKVSCPDEHDCEVLPVCKDLVQALWLAQPITIMLDQYLSLRNMSPVCFQVVLK